MRCDNAMLSPHTLTPSFSPPPGGPLAKDCSDPSNLLNTGGANNFPLRGGKIGVMEGGIRLNAFASGGLIPPAQRGTTYEGWLHLADFYATACALAGVDPTDQRAAAAGLPPIDSLDFSAVLLGTNMTSPRTEIAIGSSDDSDHTGNTIVAGLIDADGWKLIIPGNVDPAFYQGPVFRASGAGGAAPTTLAPLIPPHPDPCPRSQPHHHAAATPNMQEAGLPFQCAHGPHRRERCRRDQPRQSQGAHCTHRGAAKGRLQPRPRDERPRDVPHGPLQVGGLPWAMALKAARTRVEPCACPPHHLWSSASAARIYHRDSRESIVRFMRLSHLIPSSGPLLVIPSDPPPLRAALSLVIVVTRSRENGEIGSFCACARAAAAERGPPCVVGGTLLTPHSPNRLSVTPTCCTRIRRRRSASTRRSG